METLEKHGPAHALPLHFKAAALRTIMTHANDWFDEWQQGFYCTPDGLNIDAYQKLRTKCGDWARRKELDADTENKVSMDVGGFNEAGSESPRELGGWGAAGWAGEEGCWWPDNWQ